MRKCNELDEACSGSRNGGVTLKLHIHLDFLHWVEM